MKIKDTLTTTEQFELDISMEELLIVLAEGVRASGYYIYEHEPYLDTYEECESVRVEIIASEIQTEDIFTKAFAEKLQQVLKDKANNDKQKGQTNETND